MDFEKIMKHGQDYILEYGLRILGAILIVVVAKIVASFAKKTFIKILSKGKSDQTIIKFTGQIIYALIIMVAVISALGQLGVQTTSFIAILGSMGLAVGLALQGTLQNFASGFLLLVFRPFKTGDFIEGAGVMGSVHEIGIFNTILLTPDNKTIIIPNQKLTSDNITNFSAQERRRIDLIIGCSYDDNIPKVKETLEKILADEERILQEPTPTIGVLSFGDSSINFAVRPWVKPSDYWPVYFSLHEQIKFHFDENDISIPYPQRDVHLYNEK